MNFFLILLLGWRVRLYYHPLIFQETKVTHPWVSPAAGEEQERRHRWHAQLVQLAGRGRRAAQHIITTVITGDICIWPQELWLGAGARGLDQCELVDAIHCTGQCLRQYGDTRCISMACMPTLICRCILVTCLFGRTVFMTLCPPWFLS